jgi:hypothetical protein
MARNHPPLVFWFQSQKKQNHPPLVPWKTEALLHNACSSKDGIYLLFEQFIIVICGVSCMYASLTTPGLLIQRRY